MNQSSENLTDKPSKQSSDSVTRSVSVAVIGAGTAGQNAFRQASKIKKDILESVSHPCRMNCHAVAQMTSQHIVKHRNSYED